MVTRIWVQKGEIIEGIMCQLVRSAQIQNNWLLEAGRETIHVSWWGSDSNLTRTENSLLTVKGGSLDIGEPYSSRAKLNKSSKAI